MAKPLFIEMPCLLLCEGEDEVQFFNAWLPELSLSQVQVIAYQGKEKLSTFLADLSKARGFDKVHRIAVTRDADDDAHAAQQALEYAVAHSPIAANTPPLFVFPGEGKQGALESLWLASLEDEPFTACVEGFFQCIQDKGWEPSQAFAKNEKARAQLWIATKAVPNERFGHAAWHGRKDTDKEWMREKWIDFTHPAFDSIKAFLLSAFATQ